MARKTYTVEEKNAIMIAYDNYVTEHGNYGAVANVAKQYSLKRDTLDRWIDARKGKAQSNQGNADNAPTPVEPKPEAPTKKRVKGRVKKPSKQEKTVSAQLVSADISPETIKRLSNIKRMKMELDQLQSQLDTEVKALVEAIGE